MFQYLIALAFAGAGWLGFRALKGQSILPSLTLTPGGSSDTHTTMADQVAQTGQAKPDALALYGYLKTHGADGSPALSALVLAFQSATTSDPAAAFLTGPIPVTGTYDAKTSAALTIYTHDPIPASTPPAPSPPPPLTVIMDASVPGSAATSGFNLYTYLKAHGNDKSATLKALCQQFQMDANTDPKYPGPANGTGLPTIVKTKLTTDGSYGPATRAALKVLAADAP